MSDTTLPGLTVDTAPGLDSLIYTVDDPAGTPADRQVTVKDLIGVINVELMPFGPATDVAVGDSADFLHIPAKLNNRELVEIRAYTPTAGAATDGDSATVIQIFKVTTDSADMLSAALEIGADTAGTSSQFDSAGTISTAVAVVVTDDILRIDVDQVPGGTAPQGLLITMGFK